MELVAELRYKNPTKGFSGSFMVELRCCLKAQNVTFLMAGRMFLVASENRDTEISLRGFNRFLHSS